MSGGEPGELQQALDRIDALASALEQVADPGARETARELLQLVLDLHGLALARALAIVAAAENGRELVASLAGDAQVRAVLLLHGLHPEPVEERVREAVERLRPELDGDGCRVRLVEVTAGGARLQVVGAAGRGAAGTAGLRRRIEAAIVDLAPDLEEIVIEVLDAGAEQAALAAG